MSPDSKALIYRLGRVCILEPYRKFGLGFKLMGAAPHSVLKRQLSKRLFAEDSVEVKLHTRKFQQ